MIIESGYLGYLKYEGNNFVVRRVFCRVVSQFGEESTKVLEV
jgi:hypothetical protein